MYAFCKQERKKRFSRLPPSMEGQTHLTLGKKREKIYSLPPDKPNSGKKGKKPGIVLSWKISYI